MSLQILFTLAISVLGPYKNSLLNADERIVDNFIIFSSLSVFSCPFFAPVRAQLVKSTTYSKINLFLSVAKFPLMVNLLIGPKPTGKLLIVKGENRVQLQRY